MRKIILLLAFAALGIGCGAVKTILTVDKTPVQTRIDLVHVVDDKVEVTIDPGAFTSDLVTFYMPETVPGTYSIDDYGQYTEGLKAFDYKGDPMPVQAVGVNSWTIENAKELDKISYFVNDTYDIENETDDAVFSPAGTNIKAGEDYLLNLHGFVGYFDGFQEVPYELHIQVPPGLVATTSLPKMPAADQEAGTDTYLASRYFEVIDNPILYAAPNTAIFQLKDIKVTIGVYSPGGVYRAEDLKARMQKMMEAQKAFLGDINGTRKYNILLYFSTMEPTDARGFGALEHHTSTVVVLPEPMPRENLEQAMVDVVSHEFFHIVTPLSVHSKEIQYFDFNHPKMSEHLWMYEGTTEYFANLFQVNQGLIDEADFYRRMMDKIQASKFYNDSLSFTTMSRNVLEEPYKDNYGNVYEKGALINMALDIRLRELSKGEKGVLWLMKQLSAIYDKDTPFEDDTLIDTIVALTYPEIRTFFDTYVIGDTPIDYSEFLAKVGLRITDTMEESGYFFKGEEPYIDVDPADQDKIFLRKDIPLNTFFKDLGLQGGDVIESIDGRAIDLEAMRSVIGESFGWDPDKQITMSVQRGEQEIRVQGAVGTPTAEVRRIIPMETATPGQVELREAWLKG